MVETDSTEFQAAGGWRGTTTTTGFLIQEIMTNVGRFAMLSLDYVSRSAKMAAYELAHFGRCSK